MSISICDIRFVSRVSSPPGVRLDFTIYKLSLALMFSILTMYSISARWAEYQATNRRENQGNVSVGARGFQVW